MFKSQERELLDFVKNDEECVKQLKKFDDSEALAIWEHSLTLNEPAYYLYDEKFFLVASFICWKKYSKNYIKHLYDNEETNKLISDCSNIVDLGNGLGYSTQYLTNLFGDKFSAIQLPNTEQYKYNEMLKIKLVDLSNCDADGFIAFDFMEHILEPIKYLDEMLLKKPKLLIFANSFNTRAVGHFREYKVNDVMISEKKIGRHFNNHLRAKGYEKLKLKFWNDRPAVWKLK